MSPTLNKEICEVLGEVELDAEVQVLVAEAKIYEGTNEIQAIDRLLRKVLADRGAVLSMLLERLQQEAARCAGDPRCAQAGTDAFYGAKQDTARFAFQYLLPELEYRLGLLRAGGQPLAQIAPLPE